VCAANRIGPSTETCRTLDVICTVNTTADRPAHTALCFLMYFISQDNVVDIAKLVTKSIEQYIMLISVECNSQIAPDLDSKRFFLAVHVTELPNVI